VFKKPEGQLRVHTHMRGNESCPETDERNSDLHIPFRLSFCSLHRPC